VKDRFLIVDKRAQKIAIAKLLSKFLKNKISGGYKNA